MNTIKTFSCCCLLLISLSGQLAAQPKLSSSSKKAIEFYTEADNFRVRGQFAKAIELLNHAVEKDKKFEEAYFRLALTYKNQGNLLKATENYETGLSLSKDLRKQTSYRYELADCYLKLGNYEKALAYTNLYLNVDKASTTKNDQAKVWKQQAEYGIAHAGEDLGYRAIKLTDTVNSFPMQYFPVLTADNRQLIFTKRNGHGHDDDEDLFIAIKDEAGRWSVPVSLSPNINTTFREGACTVSADGRHLIFTECGGRGYGRCDLYETKKTGDVWSVPANLGPMINSRDWDVQPALSADGQELYFVSDRKGGAGGSDIWYSKKDSSGHWMKATNAGPVINTRYDEISPFIHANNRNLYFASNAHPGFGGMDIFVSEKIDRKWTAPKNMGAPLNNFEDQYSFFVTADGRRAYFAKDEAGTINNTKLFTTNLPVQRQVEYYSNVVKGVVHDKSTGLPLQAQVELFDIKKNERLSFVQSDSVSGEYTMVLTQGAEYALYCRRPGYLFTSMAFNYISQERAQPVVVNIDLQKASVNAMAVLNNVFFETDKYALDEKSFTELDEIIRFLQSNPSIRVEIGGYTDNVGAAAYNQQLSEKRAQSVAKYLTAHGVTASRILEKGYGAEHPVKPNDTEENRKVNRRIEFRIVK